MALLTIDSRGKGLKQPVAKLLAAATVYEVSSTLGLDDNSESVKRYYHRRESRWGYQLLLDGAKHFGFYQLGQSKWEFSSAMRAAETRLANELDLPAGARILDAGCGVGEVATNLARWRDWQISGVDILGFNIDEARKRAAAKGVLERTNFTKAMYDTADLGEGAFDGAYTMESLVHVPVVERALGNLHRSLKPGGRLVSFEYSHVGFDKMPSAATEAIQQVNQTAAMPTFNRFAPGVHAATLHDAGFTNIVVCDMTAAMLPMLDAFRTLAALPYAVARGFGVSDVAVNAMSAVEFWRWRGFWSYNIVTAVKPRGSI